MSVAGGGKNKGMAKNVLQQSITTTPDKKSSLLLGVSDDNGDKSSDTFFTF